MSTNSIDPSTVNRELNPILRSLEVGLILILFAAFAGQLPPDVNESHYLTKAKHAWDSSFCPGDLFLSSSFSHWLFYQTTAWLNAFLTLDQVAWTGRWITWALLAFAWQRLSWRIAATKGLSILSAAVFLILNDRFHLAGEWVVGGFEAKGLAYFFVLMALGSLTRSKLISAAIFLGAATSFHVLVGGWSIVAMLIAIGLKWQADGVPAWNRVEHSNAKLALAGLATTGLVLVGVLPPLMADQSASPDESTLASLIYVNQRIAHHLNFNAFPARFVARFLILILACIGLAKMIGRFPSLQNRWLGLWRFALGALTISFGGVWLSGMSEQGTAQANLSASLLRFYWFRLADFAIPMALSLGSSAIFIKLWNAGRESASEPAVQTRYRICGIVFALFMLSAMAAVIVERQQESRPRADAKSLPTYPQNADRTLGTYQNWRKVCQWISESTPKDAVFITPANQQTFKWYAGRTEVVCWKDVPQDAASMVQWRQRLIELSEPQRRFDTGLMSYSDAQLRQFSERYQATHLLVPQRHVDLMTEPTELRQVYPEDRSKKSTYVVFEF